MVSMAVAALMPGQEYLGRAANEYDHGCPELRVVDPRARTLTVHREADSRTVADLFHQLAEDEA